jgi:hypothetical protein
VRWALDGSGVYFRWHPDPAPDEDPELDPWFRVDREGKEMVELPDSLVHLLPPPSPTWSPDGRKAVWVSGGKLYLWEREGSAPGASPLSAPDETLGHDLVRTKILYSGSAPVRFPEFTHDGRGVLFMLGEDLYRHDPADGRITRLTRRHTPARDTRSPFARWLEGEQRELIRQHDEVRAREAAVRTRARELEGTPVQPIPLPEGVQIDWIRLSPDEGFLTVRWTRPAQRESVVYADYVHESGYTRAPRARPKVGEPRDQTGMGIVRMDPRVDPEKVEMLEVSLHEAGDRPTLIHGPWWSLEGDRAAVQVLSLDHKDLWIGLLDPERGQVEVVAHLHDPAWIGGPPIQGGSLRPTLLEWLPGGQFVFASESSGWSHLYLAEADGRVRPLTQGEWEVRGAQLSRDRSTWLLQTSQAHPADDHLYLMPATGGELVRITERGGRSVGPPLPQRRQGGRDLERNRAAAGPLPP